MRNIAASMIATSLSTGSIVVAAAQPEAARVTCEGVLVDVWLGPKSVWPLAVIYDEAHNYTCSYDRANATHDPLKACVVGETCRISGTYRKHEGYAGGNPTYSIQMLEGIERIGDE
jgi:hypothetical protein